MTLFLRNDATRLTSAAVIFGILAFYGGRSIETFAQSPQFAQYPVETAPGYGFSQELPQGVEGFQVLSEFNGQLPNGFDINSVPLLEQRQPNQPRELPKLQIPRTDAELAARYEALKSRFAKPPLSIQRSTPGRLLRYSLIGGPDETFLAPGGGGGGAGLRPIYALGALCWNIPCENRRIFRTIDSLPAPAVGFGFQSQRGELLAALAFAGVDRSYEVRAEDANGQKFTIDDLVEWEKRSCGEDANLSLVAVGLAHYMQDADAVWRDSFGDEWTLLRILDCELKRPVDWASADAVDKLLGITYLVARLKKGNSSSAPQVSKAENFLVAVKSLAWETFDGDKLGDALFFDKKVKATTPYMKLYVAGRMTRWLALTASPNELSSAKMKNAVAEVCALVDSLFNSVDDLDQLAPLDEESLGVAMQATAIYLKRVRAN
ncbi:MAG: hypothetical protein HUK22_08220 [Thermoguttaceae bacterium]|nr:hypothetical protein [Thermoguttaceae bacterium]